MKIRAEHYEHMRSEMVKALATLDPKRVAAYRAEVTPKRFRWDLVRGAGLVPFITGTLYAYADDTHIDTALRHIVANLPRTD